jgi:Uncharacterized conserved domain (SAYSvFN)
LDAGPFVIILTILVVILTVGLGDDNQITNPNRISAYSVFNRGFQRLMGSVDAEQLLQQHIGGGIPFPPLEGQNVVPPQQRRHEQQPQAQIIHPPVQDPHPQDDEDQNIPNNLQPEGARYRARKSGKKSRRGDLQHRREMQEHRRIALEMGFGDDENDENLMIQRIIMEQAVGANGE